MSLTLEAVAEKLAGAFPDESTLTVMQVVADCAGEFPDSGPLFVEQAARARLESGA